MVSFWKSLHAYKDKLSLLITGLSFLAGGMVYWTIPSADIELISKPFILKWSISVILISLISFPVGKKRPLPASIRITMGFIAAIMARIGYDTLAVDPTSHNLWPFEIAILLGITFPISFFVSAILFLAFRKSVQP